jgi:hypothetical protein
MGSEKAWYWLAVGVLGLVVSNNFAARHEGGIRCLGSRTLAAVQQVSGQATHLVAMAEMTLGRGETRFVGTQTVLAGAQARLASVQCVMAQHEAALARVQAEHAQVVAMQELSRTVDCPRQGLRMMVPQPHRGTI